MTRSEVKQHNQREWVKKMQLETCPDTCEFRGKPHQHIYEAKLIDWDGKRIDDPQFPYGLAQA
jgi:hypothetical protein